MVAEEERRAIVILEASGIGIYKAFIGVWNLDEELGAILACRTLGASGRVATPKRDVALALVRYRELAVDSRISE